MSQILPPLLLASSSPYRSALLKQLGLVFDTFSPDINEAPLSGELPQDLAKRLSIEKALTAHKRFPHSIIIASDQVACLEGSNESIGKPLTHENAIRQLLSYSGKTLHFYTGLCVQLPQEFAKDKHFNSVHSSLETFSVSFRQLSKQQVTRYVNIEEPLNCAGSFKAEGLGISLFEKFSGRDYNSLIGLPLMALIDIFHKIEIDVLDLPSHLSRLSHCAQQNTNA